MEQAEPSDAGTAYLCPLGSDAYSPCCNSGQTVLEHSRGPHSGHTLCILQALILPQTANLARAPAQRSESQHSFLCKADTSVLVMR